MYEIVRKLKKGVLPVATRKLYVQYYLLFFITITT